MLSVPIDVAVSHLCISGEAGVLVTETPRHKQGRRSLLISPSLTHSVSESPYKTIVTESPCQYTTPRKSQYLLAACQPTDDRDNRAPTTHLSHVSPTLEESSVADNSQPEAGRCQSCSLAGHLIDHLPH